MYPALMNFSAKAVVSATLLWISWGVANSAHPYFLPQLEGAPERLLALVEIPAGSFIKYEIHESSGHVIVDRFLTTPVAYPANYGSLPSMFAADGDPLDILIFTRIPVAPGVLIEVRPIGTLRMRDQGEVDDKIIAVPADDVDSFYQEVRDIHDLPEEALAGIEAFFRRYKSNDPADKRVTTDGFIDTASTIVELQGYLQRNQPEETPQ